MNTFELKRVAVPFGSEAPTYGTKLFETVKFDEWDIYSLIDLITRQYHFNARKNLIVISDLAQQVFCRQSEKHPELAKLVETLFLFFHDLLAQIKKEEQILFPNIIQLSEKRLYDGPFNYSTFGLIREYVLKAQNENRNVVKQFGLFRWLTHDYGFPKDSSVLYQSLHSKMKEFENEMMLHIQLENDILFPKAIQMDEN